MEEEPATDVWSRQIYLWKKGAKTRTEQRQLSMSHKLCCCWLLGDFWLRHENGPPTLKKSSPWSRRRNWTLTINCKLKEKREKLLPHFVWQGLIYRFGVTIKIVGGRRGEKKKLRRRRILNHFTTLGSPYQARGRRGNNHGKNNNRSDPINNGLVEFRHIKATLSAALKLVNFKLFIIISNYWQFTVLPGEMERLSELWNVCKFARSCKFVSGLSVLGFISFWRSTNLVQVLMQKVSFNASCAG